MRSVRPVLAAVLVTALLGGTGCYTGHAITRDKLQTLSNDVEPGIVDVEADDGEVIPVGSDTTVVVTDNDGLRHRLRPFTFKVSQTQLVAPEQDLILGLDTIDVVEVRQISTVATLGMVGVGVATVGAVAASVVLTAGDDSFE